MQYNSKNQVTNGNIEDKKKRISKAEIVGILISCVALAISIAVLVLCVLKYFQQPINDAQKSTEDNNKKEDKKSEPTENPDKEKKIDIDVRPPKIEKLVVTKLKPPKVEQPEVIKWYTKKIHGVNTIVKTIIPKKIIQIEGPSKVMVRRVIEKPEAITSLITDVRNNNVNV